VTVRAAARTVLSADGPAKVVHDGELLGVVGRAEVLSVLLDGA
jgi:hypothetical protein